MQEKKRNRLAFVPNQGLPSWLVSMLAVMAGISVANIYYCQPLLGMISEDTGLSAFQVNLIPVLTQVGYALGLLLIIPLGDMYNRRTTVLVNFGMLVLSLLAIYFSNNAVLLLGASLVTGFCSVSPQVFMPFVSLYSRKEEKSQKVGVVLSGLLVGILASRVISGYVGHLFGWRTIYVVAAVVMALSAMVLLRVFPYVAPTYQGTFVSLMKSIKTLAVKYPLSLLYSIRSGFAFGSFLGLWACLAFRMKEAPFFQGSDVVGMLGICGIVGALTALVAGKYIYRFGVERVNAMGVALIISAWVIMALFDDSYLGIIAGVIVIDIGMQCVQLSNQSSTMNLCPEATSRMNTIYMVSYFIGGSFGTFLAGTLWNQWGWAGTVASGLLMISMTLIISIYHHLKKK
ncbi:MAG: MFS transporter [Muribaculaceae bacterium]|nr:MFS transporter [Muribaculaceae bacterium]